MDFQRTEKLKDSFERLDRVILDAKFKYLGKEPTKSDSWRDMKIDDLSDIFQDKCFEYIKTPNDIAYDKLLDVINVACMLAARLKEENKEEK